jgi:tetratricopeptide (TPR) repeat protein
LLDQAGFCLYVRGRYTDAEHLYQRALTSREKALGPEHSDVATSLNNLIWRHFSYNQGQHAKAKPLYQRALAIWEKALAPERPNVVTSLNNLARSPTIKVNT